MILTKLDQLDAKVVKLQERADEEKAIEARVRILRFNGELIREVRHTEEEFNQTLSDIDVYEDFCSEHPKFPNSRAVIAVENIKRAYDKCLNERSFLQ